ncbi:MAG: hypothetical protein ARM1_0552 [Candidatus Micrarchaeota archaeon]|nr:MAG: hypothetical protein ARM1_0552 [Candidatus Micrarchaeota archaeon]
MDLYNLYKEIVDALIFAEEIGIDFSGDFDPRTPSESGLYPCPYMAGRAASLNEISIFCHV